MKNGESYNSSRRTFLKGIAAILLAAPLVQSCRQKAVALLVKLTGTNHILGHRLWAKNFPKPSKTIEVSYLIIGAGISGLSAARQLSKKGINDFLLIEMENHAGGNSSNGENAYSKFPLGAHYLPLPNFHDKELINFLHEEKIITGFDANGFPVFDEEQLTFSPQERLFYKNTWQEGLVPRYGNSSDVDAEFYRFFKDMEGFKNLRGNDGKYVFDIPVSAGSSDTIMDKVDNLTMRQLLEQNGFKAEELYEYVDYCCRDDFGLGIDYVSAWAGIHYFAGRKHDAGNSHDNVLTWPEGNARLAHHLKKYSEKNIKKNWLAFDINPAGDKVTVLAFDDVAKEAITFVADKVIMATPQFVNQYLIKDRKATGFTYAPWLLATLTLKDIPEGISYPLCWDNVIYKGKGLGYIYDQHQSVGQLQQKKVITYYHSFSTADTKKARKEIYRQNKEHWKAFVLSDLNIAHPGIEELVEEIQIHILGHGMISPQPGFITGEAKSKASQPIANKIYFAHSDLSGISIFEEAFHQGINAVNHMLNETTLDT